MSQQQSSTTSIVATSTSSKDGLHEEEEQLKVLNIQDIMSHSAKLSSDQNNNNTTTGRQVICLYYDVKIDQEEEIIADESEFKILNEFNNLNNSMNIKQIVHVDYYQHVALFLIEIYGINYLYQLNYSNQQEQDQFVKFYENAKELIDLNDDNDTNLNYFNGIDNGKLKLVPFKFRKNEFVIKMDNSGTLMKTNLNSIWDITRSVINIKDNKLEHLVFIKDREEDETAKTHVKYIEDFNDEIVDFEAFGHCVFLTKNGKIYGYGYNTYRQLNLDGEDDNLLEFISDISFNSLKIKKILPGSYKTHFITENGEVYASGENSNFNIGCSEGKTKQEILEYILEDNGSFHSYPASKCDLIDEKYEIEHVYQIGYGGSCHFLTKDKKLLVCGKYYDTNKTEIVSIGDVYPIDGEIDQLHIFNDQFLLIITTNRKVQLIGLRNLDPNEFRNSIWFERRLGDQKIIRQVKKQIEVLLSLDERIFGKLQVYPNRSEHGCILKLELSLDLVTFFKSLNSGLKRGNFSDLTFKF